MSLHETPVDPWGWAGSVQEFLSTPSEIWRKALERHYGDLLRCHTPASQLLAWDEEGKVLRASLQEVCTARPEATDWSIIFEYELPLEGGRRPDVVVLAGGSVVVLEFKQDYLATPAAIDQVQAYTRDLAEYHEATHGRNVMPVLVLTRADQSTVTDGSIAIVNPARITAAILDAVTSGHIPLDYWLRSPYVPLPTLVAAARRIFEHEPLPAVKRAQSTSIPEAVELLGRLAEEAAATGERVLAFVAGVPGSGKTLTGLTLVYERTAMMSAATFLSGNGPLVEVLRDALRSKVFVRDLHAFIRTYGATTRVPTEQVIVFDEAQRAWDAGYMHVKRGINQSEPQLLVQIGERLPDWAVLVGLVGDGQEIHVGEEGGIEQWHDALVSLGATGHWRVHCPPRLASKFPGMDVTTHDALDLTLTLRSRRAERLHEWVADLLNGCLSDAASRAHKVQAEGFPMYLTRDLEAAKSYVRERYAEAPEARYGLLASARSQGFLPRFGVDSSWVATRKVKLARWYNEPAGNPASCCALTDVVTEFGCQGLELDLPIVCWGNDLIWSGHGWWIRPVRSRYEMQNPDQLRRNAYRVLLTRGRDGFVIYLPLDHALDPTEHALLTAGIKPLATNAP